MIEDLTSGVFGRLTVIEQSPIRKHKRIAYKCLCECGQMALVTASDLFNNIVGSCGCQKGYRKSPGVAAFNRQLRLYTKSARTRGFEFTLANEEATVLFNGNCHYCGEVPDPFNGIDRKDNREGYTKENSVSCCAVCNWCKGSMSYDNFLSWIDTLIAYRS